MKIIYLLLNSVKTTVCNIKSNKQVFLVSIATIAIALSILGLFLVVFVNLNSFLSTWSKQVQLVIYLDDGINKAKMKKLEILISGDDNIHSYDFISREDAWKNFKQSFSGNNNVLAELTFNPLPASYNIRFKDYPNRLERIRKFAKELAGYDGVESLEYGEKWIVRFEKFMIVLRVFLLAVGGLLSLGLVLIISNTIKLSIYSRRDEIELMLLIGSTHRFVKIPLILEGILQGIAGALMALGLIKLIHFYMKFQLQTSFDTLLRASHIQFLTPPLIYGLLAISIFIGWMGSHISINQFLYSGVKE